MYLLIKRRQGRVLAVGGATVPEVPMAAMGVLLTTIVWPKPRT